MLICNPLLTVNNFPYLLFLYFIDLIIFEYIEKNVFFKSSLVFELSCPRDEYYNKTDELITHISA